MEYAIRLKGLTKSFQKEKVLKNITHDFEKGKIHGIMEMCIRDRRWVDT